ncbi:MAG: calcium-binding EGF-like domain-containing protein [Chitinophagales bacterium]|nr:calcium-binding EGF-like domain-containing protein [Chitinophagales bacterium]
MKKVSILGSTLLAAVAFSTAMFFNACESDPCKDVICQNQGTCVDGTCQCADGYEGTNCETRTADKYAGTWSAVDVCTSGTWTYAATIAASSTEAPKILITNFGGFGSSVVAVATVNGNTMSVPSQTFGAVSLSGSGTLSSNGLTLSIAYTANDVGGGSDVCTGTWDKQ